MRFAKYKVTTFFLIAALAFSFGFATGFFLGRPPYSSYTLGASGRIRHPPFLVLEISPMGYPVPGQSWTLFVYQVNTSSDSPIFRPFVDSIVAITLKSNGFKDVYYLPVDENGRASFPYLSEYSDVAFQAFGGELESQKIILSVHFVSSEVLDQLLAFNVFMVLASIFGGSFAIWGRKMRRLIKLMFLIITCLFAFVTFSSLYTRYFRGNAWGYPERIMNGIITFTLLKYVSYSAAVLLVILFTVLWLSKKQELSTQS